MSVSIESEVKELLPKAPVPPGYQFPKGASEEELDAVENRLGFSLPSILRSWLQYCNGALVGPGGLLGINASMPALDIEACIQGHAGWRDVKLVPIAGDGCGNYYVMHVSQGRGDDPIFFVDTVRDPLRAAYVVASDLWHFLRFLLLKELEQTNWPFSPEDVLAADPAIMSVNVAPRPWETESR